MNPIETIPVRHAGPRHPVSMMILTGILVLGSGCSVRDLTTRAMADALSESGSVYASDQDLELIGDATPFALKTMETVLADQPEHHRLLVATARAFTQYAYLYVEWPADRLEDRDVTGAYRQRIRARRLYLRARDYGLRALETISPGVSANLIQAPEQALSGMTPAEVPALYWAGVSWGAAIALGKDDPRLLAELPAVEALIKRALALDELAVGCVMDIFSAIVVLAPLIVPIGLAFGVDPVHLGAIFLANMELGFLTPPVGMNLFFASSRFKRPLDQVYRSVIPLFLVLCAGVLIITYFPWLSTLLPALTQP